MEGIPLRDVRKIGAAVVGTGFISTVHIGALRRLGVSVEGVLGSTPERGAERAAALGVARAYGTLDELLNDPKVQVVHVTSPNHAHYAQVKQILAAGRHVVCEKPLATNFGKRLIENAVSCCADDYNFKLIFLQAMGLHQSKSGLVGLCQGKRRSPSPNANNIHFCSF